MKLDNLLLVFDEAGAGEGAVGGADTKIIDFGLVRVLKTLGHQFTGKAAIKEMMCRAMRREDLWGVDQDFFCLCASAFSLLFFGMDSKNMVREEEGKFCLDNTIPSTGRASGLWRGELWNEFFDKLLNYDPAGDDYNMVVVDICKKFDAYVQENKALIAACLQKPKGALFL